MKQKSNLSIHTLSRVFNNTTNSYKLYWFYAILEIVKTENKPLISYEEITVKMISSIWYTVNYFKISFGKQDKLKQAVDSIKKCSNLKEDDKPEVIYPIIMEQLKDSKELQSIVADFYRYVPYRFLSPFFEEQLRGKKDSLKNNLIKTLAKDFYESSNNVPIYKLKDNESIEIHPRWMEYLKTNIVLLESFVLWNLVKFLQKRNPNIPNIGEKLFWVPQKRNLNLARKFWGTFLEEKRLNCIFSKQRIDPKRFSIDHFIPWSFVTHDLLWNLIPINASVNSSKSNNLPDLETYFSDFAHIHFQAFRVIYPKQQKLLEDYTLLFNEELAYIATYSKSNFTEKLHQHIAPLVQVAANTGFSQNWIYQNHL